MEPHAIVHTMTILGTFHYVRQVGDTLFTASGIN